MRTHKRFFKILLVCLLGSTANLAYTQGDSNVPTSNLVLSSGLEGGGYWKAGGRLQAVAGGMGLTIENTAGKGSLSNLKLLFDGNSPVSLAFAQADALQAYLDSKPEAAQAIETMGDIGRECVFMITDKDGEIDTIDDMAAKAPMRVGIKSPNSGMRVTFDYMRKQMPALGDVTLVYGNTIDMMNKFSHPLTDIERAVMVVQGPNERSPEIDMVIANPDLYRFVEINNESLTRKTASGATVYERMKVKPGAVEGASAVETICVRGLLVANKNKLTTAQRKTLAELTANQWSKVNTSDE